MQVQLPYGRSLLSGEVPDNTKIEQVRQKKWDDLKYSEEEIVASALKRPVGSESLEQIAQQKRSVTIVTCDKTRGVPSHVTIPLVLKELASAGFSKDTVKVLIATGLHKG